MPVEDVPVVVIGGSLVGLSTALFLGAQGIPSLVVERHRGTAIHPRAASFHQRTMEIFRELGVQAAVEDAAAREFVQNGAIVAVEFAERPRARLLLPLVQRRRRRAEPDRAAVHHPGRARAGAARPSRRARRRASVRDRAGRLRAGCGRRDRHLRPRDGGAERNVRARYLIAADGAHSPVRQALGIAMEGRGSFADCATIYFRADVRAMIGDRNLSVVYVNRPRSARLLPLRDHRRCRLPRGVRDLRRTWARDSHVSEGLSAERCAALVRTALGAATDFPVEIENVQPWSAMASTASSFREGRVFLAGDAAHVMPPTGGFGGNTGVGDAHNLAWKLAMVLRGEAGDGLLLDSYDAERRPVAALIVEQAYARYVLRRRSGPRQGEPHADRRRGDGGAWLSVSLGRRTARARRGRLPRESPDEPTARPGLRAPHLALARGDGAPSSTLDLAGRGFALLAGPAGEAWCQAAGAVSAQLEVPIESQCVGDVPAFAEIYGTGAEGAVLLRPDGYVAWRTGSVATDGEATLRRVLERILDVDHRAPAAPAAVG